MTIADPALLSEIRRKEAEIRRRLTAEREAAEKTIAQARQQAEECIAEAAAAGRRQGETDLAQAIAAADEEADAIVARARHDAARRKRHGREKHADAVAQAVTIITGGAP